MCNGYAATPLGPGACIKEANIVYASNVGGRVCNFGGGTRSNPACNLFKAVSLSVGPRYAIHVAPGLYFPLGVAGGTIYFFGPGDGSAVVGEEGASAAVHIVQGARVVIDGLTLGGHAVTGIWIEDSDVQLHNAAIGGDSRGILSFNSNLNIDRVRATGLTDALQVNGTGTYRITNSYFRGGDLPSVAFTGASTGRFLFNTVVGGGMVQPGGLDCGATPRAIEDSIVFGANPGPNGAQTVGACSHERVVVGGGDARIDPGLLRIDPDLDASGRLLDTAANAACCIDRGERYTSSLYRDLFGTPRPQGFSNDIGAFERGQVVPASADTQIRGDLDDRANDNYGCQPSMVVGTHRGNFDNPDGTPDAMRALVWFELNGLPARLPFIQSAVLEMTIAGFDHGRPDSVYQMNVHRIVPSGARTPWIEGNGIDGTLWPAGCDNVDVASGVAWTRSGDLANETQPDFDATATATAIVRQASNVRGDQIRWDITQLVRDWDSGAVPNYGIVVRDPTSDGSFRGVQFGARDGLLRGFPDAVSGPRLIITRGPTCGGDECPRSCGTCGPGQICSPTGTCVCPQNTCGPYCVMCPAGQSCQNDICVRN